MSSFAGSDSGFGSGLQLTLHGDLRLEERGFTMAEIECILMFADPVKGCHHDDTWVYRSGERVVVLDATRTMLITCFRRTRAYRCRLAQPLAPPLVH